MPTKLFQSKSEGLPQAEKFAELSHALECDEDEGRFKELLGKIVKHKPVEKPETPE